MSCAIKGTGYFIAQPQPRRRGSERVAQKSSLSPFFRGAATVELALLSLVFVTVLLFGIHFAELGALKLRVQQAGNFALWSATGDRAHRLAGASPVFLDANALRDGQGNSPAQAARERYRDFDGTRSAPSNRVTLATARASGLRVRCRPTALAVQPSTVPIQRLASAYRYARWGGREVDSISCTAQARIDLVNVPSSFAEGADGLFDEPHPRRPFIDVCAFGRANGGTCPGGMPIAVDDWGLQGDDGDESAECGFDCSMLGAGNQAYKKTVERLYENYKQVNSTGSVNLQTFVKTLFTANPNAPGLMAQVPVDERDFRFAFIGDRGTREFEITTREVDVVGTGAGPTQHVDHHWATTPYSTRYRAAYRDRENCFGGLPCDKPAFDKQRW
ncbi:MAG: pilus assembly protein [Myxococcaceae bacterium]|nr:pilus assembly protein [Myxococcaceae bacterium]